MDRVIDASVSTPKTAPPLLREDVDRPVGSADLADRATTLGGRWLGVRAEGGECRVSTASAAARTACTGSRVLVRVDSRGGGR